MSAPSFPPGVQSKHLGPLPARPAGPRPRIGEDRVQDRTEWGVRWYAEDPIVWVASEEVARRQVKVVGFGELYSRLVQVHPARAER